MNFKATPSDCPQADCPQSEHPQPERIQPVIIIGMHRSGTSLTSSMLQAAGIDIGQSLLGPDVGNQLGHFEDIELYSLHCEILEAQGIHKNGWTAQSHVEVPPAFCDRAQKLYHERNQTTRDLASGQNKNAMRIWGWKDPRTALFLNFWQAMIPTAKFVCIYRHPHQVIASLFERGDEVFSQQPHLTVESWLAYNRAILNCYQQHSERCFLFNVENFHQGEKTILKPLAKKLNLPLDLSCRDVYQPNELHKSTENLRSPEQLKKYRSQIHNSQQYDVQIQSLYRALEAVADLPLNQDIGSKPDLTVSSTL